MGYYVEVAGPEDASDMGESFAAYADAVAYANRLADAWEETDPCGNKADRSWASRDNMYAIRYGRWAIQIVKDED